VTHRRRNHRPALTLVEAIIMVMILGIVSVGVGVGLQSATRITYATDTRLATHTRLLEKLEAIRDASFTQLTAAIGNQSNAFCDTVILDGKTLDRTVAVSYFDVNGGGAETDIVQVTVTIDSQSMKTLVCQP
jgi:type II secretory pathway pseudopilin PulG